MSTSLRGVRVPGVSVKTPSTLQPHNNPIGFTALIRKQTYKSPITPSPESPKEAILNIQALEPRTLKEPSTTNPQKPENPADNPKP